MLHLSPDSRLLISLVKQEQAYASQLHSLLDASGTSLSALAAYASSSPPTISRVLNGVASALSGADEALLNYGEALNNWIDQLGTIKSKEEEVVNIGRDREILVTRLLKISQKSKSPPLSLLHAAPDSSSIVSLPTFSSKITTAQTELQACESHLADHERELEKHRIHAIRYGLKLRCEALIQCGRVWGEMGRRAISMIEDLSDASPLVNGHSSDSYKPLPHPNPDHDRDSILSSLTPSQSASQIGAASQSVSLVPHEKPYRLDIPAPHRISEHSTIPRPSTYTSRVSECSKSSSEDDGPVEVHENPPFQPASILNRQKTVKTVPSTPVRSLSPVSFPSPSNKVQSASSDVGPPMISSQGKQGRKSTGIFGGIALLFRTSMNNKPTPPLSGTKWSTRTDNNLKSVKTDAENSSDEEVPRVGRLRKAKARSAPKHDAGRRSAMLTSFGTSALSVSSSSASPVRIKNKTSVGKLGSGPRSNTAVEPVSPPRARANTLTHSPSGDVLLDTQEPIPRNRGRRASWDGRRGLTDPGTTASSQTVGSSPIWKPPKQSTTSKAGSLMSIVEGVSYSDDPSSRLEVVRAPGSPIAGLPLLVHHPPPLPTTASTFTSLMQTPVAQKPSILPNQPASSSARNSLSAKEKKPLRSAMRIPNRDKSVSPPPSGSPNGSAAEPDQLSSSISPLSLPGPASPSLRPSSISRPEIPSTIIESPRQSIVDSTKPEINSHRQSTISMNTDDSVSVSSYETGHEDLDDETLESTRPVPLITPPVNENVEPLPSSPLPNASPLNGMSEGLATDRYDFSSATSTDTATGVTPTRRKSVRMSSLPPEFSATPPALEDDEVEARSPWGGSSSKGLDREEGWKTRISTSNTAWDDSSSEDEAYKSARKALSRVERRLEKQNAAK